MTECDIAVLERIRESRLGPGGARESVPDFVSVYYGDSSKVVRKVSWRTAVLPRLQRQHSDGAAATVRCANGFEREPAAVLGRPMVVLIHNGEPGFAGHFDAAVPVFG